MKSQEQCVGCVYWKSGAGGHENTTLFMCHHLLETGKRRIDQNGVCLSRLTSRQQKQNMIIKAPQENKCKKKVLAVEDNIVFESMTAAEKHYKLSHGRVCEIANKPNRTARGQHFVTV